MTTPIIETHLPETVLNKLRQAGNPFRNYFARNPDDEVCARYHVPDLFARERSQLLGVVELYRTAGGHPAEMVPVLGNKGAGKTHLLHSIKHGGDGGWQMLVTPGTFQKDTDFLEYLLFQVIDTLLGGGKQKGRRPLEYLGEELTRRLLHRGLAGAGRDEQLDLFPAPGLMRWTRKLGLGSNQAQEKIQWLLENLSRPRQGGLAQLRRLCAECGLPPERACEFVCTHIGRTETLDTAGMMRRHLLQGFVRACIVGDESDLANFLTYGFAELDFKVRPSRQDMVLGLFKALMTVFKGLQVPVVVAFDQLEDLLLARRNEDGRRTAETFFAGIVQAMHQIEGLCFLVFAERGLWNRFVPSLDGYIQDRLDNPVHVPGHGTVKALRLEAPSPELVRKVVAARMRPVLEEIGADAADDIYPFDEEQIQRIAATEPTLRDMLQQFRHLFDHLVFGEVEKNAYEAVEAAPSPRMTVELPPEPKSVTILETNTTGDPHVPDSIETRVLQETPRPGKTADGTGLADSWRQEIQAARRNLEPDGSLTGATRELQAGLGSFLQICFEHGVKVGPWRLQHVVPEWTFGEHPTYGVMTIAHWVCRDGQPWKVGIGLFLGRGTGKPKDLEIKLGTLDMEPPMIDHLILLRQEDDVVLTGKSKGIWQEAQRRGRHARLEPISLDHFAVLYGFPRWLTALSESLAANQDIPNLADLLQNRCEKLLEQVCMPVSP